MPFFDMKSKIYYFFRSKPRAFNAPQWAERIRSNSALQKCLKCAESRKHLKA